MNLKSECQSLLADFYAGKMSAQVVVEKAGEMCRKAGMVHSELLGWRKPEELRRAGVTEKQTRIPNTSQFQAFLEQERRDSAHRSNENHNADMDDLTSRLADEMGAEPIEERALDVKERAAGEGQYRPPGSPF